MQKSRKIVEACKNCDIVRNFEGYINFGYVVSSKKVKGEEGNILYGLNKLYFEKLKCSNIDQENNHMNGQYQSIEKFLNEILSGIGSDRKIVIYLPPYKIKELGKYYDNKTFVIADIIEKIERYIDTLKSINQDKYKNLDISKLNIDNIQIDYSGYIYK